MRRDGEDDDVPHEPPARRRRFVSVADQMREMLAGVGIELDQPAEPAPAAKNARAETERDETAIRAHLEPLGCPEWAIASCPSLELARTYKPKLRRKAYPSPLR